MTHRSAFPSSRSAARPNADAVDSFDSRMHEPQVSSVLVRALLDVLQRRGLATDALLGQAVDELHSEPLDRRIPLAEYQALLVRASRLSAEPALALHCGLQATESSFGLMGALVSYTHSLRHALQLVSQFHPLLLDDTRLQLSEQASSARVCCDFPRVSAAADRSLAELIVAGLVRTLRAFGCARSDIHAVCFEHTRPAHHQAYSQAFSGTERFAQAFTGVEFSQHLLDRLHLHRQPELETLLRAQAERSLERLARPSTCVERVRGLMARTCAGAHPHAYAGQGKALSMARAARTLGLSVRSLRRRLEDEGSSYRAVTQSVLQESATSLLRNPDLTLQAIAHVLGFADVSAFHKAFKRWTQLTPAEYRAAAVQALHEASSAAVRCSTASAQPAQAGAECVRASRSGFDPAAESRRSRGS